MAKKFVRGITDVKTINNQDFDTNNVNDLLSDGEHNYIHRKKKDKSEEYHNLTNNLKTIKSDNNDLLTVTNNNNTTNSATLSPKHDKLKEQVIESTRNTIYIEYGENGTEETTKVDTNPQKVLEHDNLTGNTPYVTVDHVNGEETTLINSQRVADKFTNVDSAINAKQDKLTAGEGIIIQGSTISSTGGLTPQHEAFGTRGQSYYVFKEVFGMRTTYTIEVAQGNPELTVLGDLKTDLVSKLANVSTLKNGAITLTYNGSDVKIITNTSPANGVEQATFTFYNM